MIFPDTHHAMSWAILECKFVYYEGSGHGLVPIPDYEYDKLEMLYVEAAMEHEEFPEVCVGFPKSPSAALAATAVLSGKSILRRYNKGLWKPVAKRCPICEKRPTVWYVSGSVECSCGMLTSEGSWPRSVDAWNELA